jgi:FKBP-type peptidyl-prolyl cis-trans isomerase FkpA
VKKLLLVTCLFFAGLSSCKKTDSAAVAQAQAATDDAAIQAYIKANNITATKDPSGLYYSIIQAGTGPYPTATSNISISYAGNLLDGTSFESGPSTSFALSTQIKGWQIGIPHINSGGTILLLVPSALGYGTAGNGGTVPANAVLVFRIGLQGFN